MAQMGIAHVQTRLPLAARLFAGVIEALLGGVWP